ncbi:MAG: TIR domain-containing protein [Promethearchaeota archaeon]
MNKKNFEKKESLEELNLIKLFINEGKNEKAFQLMNNFEESRDHTLNEIVSCHLLKCELLNQQGFYEELVKFAEQTYIESLGLGISPLTVDALYFKNFGLIQLYRVEEASDVIKLGEELLTTLPNKLSLDYKKCEARLIWIKGVSYNKYYNPNGDVDIALEHFYQSLALREEIGDKEEVALSLLSIIFNLGVVKGETDRALKYVERFLALIEKKELKNKYNLALGLSNVHAVYAIKGDLDRSIKYYKQSLEIFEELKNKPQIAYGLLALGELYRKKGETDLALEYCKQGLTQFSEMERLIDIVMSHGSIIQVLIDKGDLEQAWQHLDEIQQIYKNLTHKRVKATYLFYKALLLKTSPRAKNRVEAEEIFREAIEEENLYLFDAFLELCDLLLVELRMTNDLDVLEEIESLITRLLTESERMSSFALLAETYFLKAKLGLITLKVKEARKYLTKAQQIAKKHGMKQLAIKISNEHDELIKQSNLWKKLEESGSSLEERLELARLDNLMKNMRRKLVTDPQNIESEQPIFLAIISKEGAMIVSNPFTADMIFNVNRIGDFLSSFNTFSHQIFHESLDRVTFGKYKVLMNALNQFYICYMFQGQTYSAQQKISHFTEVIKKNKDIIESLENADKKNLTINVTDDSMLEEILVESFMADPQLFQVPFKAYLGDEPFVFVSYSHSNKLEVYPIIDYMNKVGINIWYDEGIPVSENWKKSIAENLERCVTFLVFISPRMLNSEWVKKEIGFALKKKKKFVAVYLKKTELPLELEFEIADIQALKKYRLDESEFYAKLKDVLKQSL